MVWVPLPRAQWHFRSLPEQDFLRSFCVDRHSHVSIMFQTGQENQMVLFSLFYHDTLQVDNFAGAVARIITLE